MKKILLAMLLAMTLILGVLFVSCGKEDVGNKGGDSPIELSPVEELFNRAGLDDILGKYDSVLVKLDMVYENGIGYNETFYAALDDNGAPVAEILSVDPSYGMLYAMTYRGGVTYAWNDYDYELVLVEPGTEFDYLNEQYIFALPEEYDNYDITDADGGKLLTVISETMGQYFLQSTYLFDSESGLITEFTQALKDSSGNTAAEAEYEINYGAAYSFDEIAVNMHKNSEDATPVSVIYGDDSFGFTASRSSSISTYPKDFRACKTPSLTKDATSLTFADPDLPIITLYLGKRAEEIDFTVTLTRSEADAFLSELEDLKETIINNGSLNKIESILVEFEDKMDYFTTQYSLAQLEFYKNINNVRTSEKFSEATEIYFDIYEAFISFCREIYDSDSFYRDMIFEGWTEEELEQILSTDDETIAIEEKMKAIQNEHTLLDPSSETWENDVAELYIEYVGLANSLAERKGYSNYYEYASEKIYNRDYSKAEREALRSLVKSYVVSMAMSAYNEFIERYNSLSATGAMILSGILYSDPRDTDMEYIRMFTDGYSDSLSASFDALFEKDALVISDSASAYPGAYTIYLDYYDEAYIFVGTTDYITNFTLVHEMGHYASTYFCDLNEIGIDVAEIHSQANEWLFLSFLDEHLSDEVRDTLVLYQLYSAFMQIAVCTAVDEFEEEVYSSNVPLDTYRIRSIMSDVYEEYGNLIDLYPEYAIQQYWEMVAVSQPVYYISYSTSLMASLDIFLYSEFEGKEEGRNHYEGLMSLSAEELGFLETIGKAGLASPFDDELYKALAQYLASYTY